MLQSATSSSLILSPDTSSDLLLSAPCCKYSGYRLKDNRTCHTDPSHSSSLSKRLKSKQSRLYLSDPLCLQSIWSDSWNVTSVINSNFSSLQPALANKKSCGLSQLIYYSVLKCEESVRSELLSNITLSGGNTKFPGFEKRLYQELSSLFDEKTTIKVKALPNRELLGWIGGAR